MSEHIAAAPAQKKPVIVVTPALFRHKSMLTYHAARKAEAEGRVDLVYASISLEMSEGDVLRRMRAAGWPV